MKSVLSRSRVQLRTATAILSSVVLLSPGSAWASNFGDFPSIVPLLFLTPFACLLVGWIASFKRNDEGILEGHDRRRFLVFSLLTLPAWLALCLLAFLNTF